MSNRFIYFCENIKGYLYKFVTFGCICEYKLAKLVVLIFDNKKFEFK